MMKELRIILSIFALIIAIRSLLKRFDGNIAIKFDGQSTLNESNKKSVILDNNVNLDESLKTLNSRQLEIFEIIKTLGEVDMSKLVSLFERVTDRTLRRDMAKLVENKIIEKIGDTKGAVYKLIKA